jgi:hypothetical protein
MRSSSLAVFVVLAVCSVVAADQGRSEIGPSVTFPIIIDTPGSYVLTTDLHVTAAETNAIEITVDNVTLDLGGHLVRGPGPSSVEGVGIFGWFVSKVSIRNGSVTGFGTGIKVGGSGGYEGVNRFEGLSISDCGSDGIRFNGGTARDIVVQNIGFASASGFGFVCTDCSISDVTVRSSFYGFLVLRGTAGNCTAIGNEYSGFDLRGSALTGGAAVDNGDTGIVASFGSLVVATTVRDNGGFGIDLNSNGNNNVINCTGYNNTDGNISGCADGNGCHQNYLP